MSDKPVTTKKKKPFSGIKAVKPIKREREYEQHEFRCDVSGDVIFFGGGGMEGCVSIRAMKIFDKWLKKNKVLV